MKREIIVCDICEEDQDEDDDDPDFRECHFCKKDCCRNCWNDIPYNLPSGVQQPVVCEACLTTSELDQEFCEFLKDKEFKKQNEILAKMFQERLTKVIMVKNLKNNKDKKK